MCTIYGIIIYIYIYIYGMTSFVELGPILAAKHDLSSGALKDTWLLKVGQHSSWVDVSKGLVLTCNCSIPEFMLTKWLRLQLYHHLISVAAWLNLGRLFFNKMDHRCIFQHWEWNKTFPHSSLFLKGTLCILIWILLKFVSNDFTKSTSIQVMTCHLFDIKLLPKKKSNLAIW